MEITYLCPAVNTPTGGIKVIYRHSEMLVNQGIKSSVFHVGNDNFVVDWFVHNAVTRKARPLIPGHDFVVIPEIWAVPFAEKFDQMRIDYAIFVQNGYLINQGVEPRNLHLLKRAYESAQLIMSISEDTTEMISLAYPQLNPQKLSGYFPV